MRPPDDRLLAYADLLARPDAPDLIGRGHRLTQRGDPDRAERTLWRSVRVHLAERRRWHATASRTKVQRMWRIA